jgi:hypothetical protein
MVNAFTLGTKDGPVKVKKKFKQQFKLEMGEVFCHLSTLWVASTHLAQ